jgi:hypothetical protein
MPSALVKSFLFQKAILPCQPFFAPAWRVAFVEKMFILSLHDREFAGSAFE